MNLQAFFAPYLIVSDRCLCLPNLDGVDWWREARLIGTATVLAMVPTALYRHYITNDNLPPKWGVHGKIGRCGMYIEYLGYRLRSFFTGEEIPYMYTREAETPEPEPTKYGYVPYRRERKYPRTVLAYGKVDLYGWPSRGGLVILEGATHVDFTWLGIDHLNPPLLRATDKTTEDEFCKKLLLLGAHWWDSKTRYTFVQNPMVSCEHNFDEMPWPTARENREIKVGYPSTGGVWIADFRGPEGPQYGDGGKIMLAKDMDERCEIIKSVGGRFYESLENFDAEGTFLKSWDGEAGGGVSRLQETWFDEDVEFGPFTHAESMWVHYEAFRYEGYRVE